MHASIHHCVHTCVRARACAFFAIVCVCLCAPPAAATNCALATHACECADELLCTSTSALTAKCVTTRRHLAIARWRVAVATPTPCLQLSAPRSIIHVLERCHNRALPQLEDRAPPCTAVCPRSFTVCPHLSPSSPPYLPQHHPRPGEPPRDSFRRGRSLGLARSVRPHVAGSRPCAAFARERRGRCARRATRAHARIAAVVWAGNGQTTAVSITPKLPPRGVIETAARSARQRRRAVVWAGNADCCEPAHQGRRAARACPRLAVPTASQTRAQEEAVG